MNIKFKETNKFYVTRQKQKKRSQYRYLYNFTEQASLAKSRNCILSVDVFS